MTTADQIPVPRQAVAIVTGPSGAGRSTAINKLEDLGFEVIDNLPLNLLTRLFHGGAHDRPLAVGIDARSRGFSAEGLLAAMDELNGNPEVDPSLVYIDCSTSAILRRYSETRRRHPLAQRESPLIGIEREQTILASLREAADILIDTTDLSPHDLRAEMGRWFGKGPAGDLTVQISSFSYKRGVPRGADMVFDCRFLRNPHWDPDLRPLTGLDAKVAAYVAEDPLYKQFFDQVADMMLLLLPAYKAEGKSYLTVALGCTGGRHRSVCVTQALAFRLAKAGWQVSSRHRELEQTVLTGESERVAS